MQQRDHDHLAFFSLQARPKPGPRAFPIESAGGGPHKSTVKPVEQIEVGADTERRKAREALEQAEVGADTERREARDAQEQAEVGADTERREARDTLEQAEVGADTQRRQARDAKERADAVEQQELLKQKHERLLLQNQQAQRLENLGQLAGGIAHDFNNLLAVILNYSSFVSEALAAPPDAESPQRLQSARNDVSQITLAAQRAATLTRQLLAFARREVIRPKVLHLNNVITGVEEMLRRTIGEHIELVISLGDDLWPILADPGQLEQVLVNLAVNARDAMPDGGALTIDTSNLMVDPDCVAGGSNAQLGRNVRLRVSDTGTGMAPEIVEHIFEPFFTTKEEGAGTGLGLATVYGILAQADSQIMVYSEPGSGTTFSITIPVTWEPALPRTMPTPFQRHNHGETILVVEDEDALREVTRRILARSGYHVICASDGPEALRIVNEYSGEIHLLITDVVMPRMLGKEVAEKICLLKPGIDVLFMSGYARPVLASQGRLDPQVALVEKPFSESNLLDNVYQVLSGHFREVEHAPAFSMAANNHRTFDAVVPNG